MSNKENDKLKSEPTNNSLPGFNFGNDITSNKYCDNFDFGISKSNEFSKKKDTSNRYFKNEKRDINKINEQKRKIKKNENSNTENNSSMFRW